MKEDVDIDRTLAPKSDQLDAIEITEPRTITITGISETGNKDQPISLRFEGDDGRPWRPAKTVRRILRECWGRNGTKWVGKSATIYNDKTVKYGGIEVGGIRVSHASHINGTVTMLLPVTRAKFAKYTVQPIRDDRPPLDLAPATVDQAAFDGLLRAMREAKTVEALADVVTNFKMDSLSEDQRAKAREIYANRKTELEN